MKIALLALGAGIALVGAVAVVPSVLNGSGSSAAVGLAGASLSASSAKTFKNCTQLNKKYPHGVGKAGAVDKVRGSTAPVTDFKVSSSLYKANKKSDRDKDGVACEKQ